MKKSKILLTTLCFALVFAVGGYFTLSHFDTGSNAKITRTITTQIDYQSLLETFDDYNLQTTEKSVSLEANKRVSLDWSELDNLSLDDESENTTNVRYNYEFDLENNFIYMTITFTEFEEVVSIETFKGAAFYDENGKLDAVFNIEGEAVLMSEMADLSTLDQCGLFSKIVKAVVKAVVVVAAVAVVTVAVVVAAPVVATAAAGVAAVIGGGTVAVGTTAAVTTLAVAALAVGVGVEVLINADVITDAIVNVLADARRILVTAATIATLKQGVFFPAAISGNSIYIIPIPIVDNATAARTMLASGAKGGVYTVLPNHAYEVAALAGTQNGIVGTPLLDSPHGNGYFAHYHVANHALEGHAFFGAPVFL